MILAAVALAMIASPAGVSAQVQQRTPSRDPLPSMAIPQWPNPSMRQAIPMPTIGLPLPTIGLPLPPTTLVPPVQAQRPVHMRPSAGQHYGRRYNGQHPQIYGPQIYPTLPFLYYMTPIVDARQHALPPPVAPPQPTKGSVAFVVQPGSAEVRVDGYYVGTADEFDGTRRTLMLDPGPHTIELSETGYETMRFQVMADASQPIVYRRELTRVAPPQSPPTPQAQADWKPSPMWVVPGCYMGNVPPKEAGLPASCDAAKGVRVR